MRCHVCDFSPETPSVYNSGLKTKHTRLVREADKDICMDCLATKTLMEREYRENDTEDGAVSLR